MLGTEQIRATLAAAAAELEQIRGLLTAARADLVRRRRVTRRRGRRTIVLCPHRMVGLP